MSRCSTRKAKVSGFSGLARPWPSPQGFAAGKPGDRLPAEGHRCRGAGAAAGAVGRGLCFARAGSGR